jgi:hypothetical protein
VSGSAALARRVHVLGGQPRLGRPEMRAYRQINAVLLVGNKAIRGRALVFALG